MQVTLKTLESVLKVIQSQQPLRLWCLKILCFLLLLLVKHLGLFNILKHHISMVSWLLNMHLNQW